eukprot:3530295-Pyramimonas_sp.AAC.2
MARRSNTREDSGRSRGEEGAMTPLGILHGASKNLQGELQEVGGGGGGGREGGEGGGGGGGGGGRGRVMRQERREANEREQRYDPRQKR